MKKPCLQTKSKTSIVILLCFLCLSIVTASLNISLVQADTTLAEGTQAVSFSAGDVFRVEDTTYNVNLIFTVNAGVLNGTANLNTTGQYLIITPDTSGSVGLDTEGTVYVSINGVYYETSYTFIADVNFIVSWQISQPTVNPIIVGAENSTFYLRSDSYTTNTETAYGLDYTNTASSSTVTDTSAGDVAATYGFRVWLIRYGGSTTELTEGTPDAVVTRAVNGSGYQNSTWTPPETSLMVGYDALKVVVYIRFDAGAWTQRAVFITHPLINSLMYAQTWTFSLYTTRTSAANTTSSFSFGSTTYNSNIQSIGFQEPLNSEVSLWRIGTGDYVGFVLGTYTDAVGASAYLIILAGFMGSLYWRTRNMGSVVFLFIIFGGSGGAIWAFVPEWAAIIVDAFLLIGAAAIVFKVIR